MRQVAPPAIRRTSRRLAGLPAEELDESVLARRRRSASYVSGREASNSTATNARRRRGSPPAGTPASIEGVRWPLSRERPAERPLNAIPAMDVRRRRSRETRRYGAPNAASFAGTNRSRSREDQENAPHIALPTTRSDRVRNRVPKIRSAWRAMVSIIQLIYSWIQYGLAQVVESSRRHFHAISATCFFTMILVISTPSISRTCLSWSCLHPDARFTEHKPSFPGGPSLCALRHSPDSPYGTTPATSFLDAVTELVSISPEVARLDHAVMKVHGLIDSIHAGLNFVSEERQAVKLAFDVELANVIEGTNVLTTTVVSLTSSHDDSLRGLSTTLSTSRNATKGLLEAIIHNTDELFPIRYLAGENYHYLSIVNDGRFRDPIKRIYELPRRLRSLQQGLGVLSGPVQLDVECWKNFCRFWGQGEKHPQICLQSPKKVPKLIEQAQAILEHTMELGERVWDCYASLDGILEDAAASHTAVAEGTLVVVPPTVAELEQRVDEIDAFLDVYRNSKPARRLADRLSGSSNY